MRASAASLPAFKVAIAGRSTTFTGLQDVGIHSQTHRAAGFAPFKTSFTKDSIKSFASACRFTVCDPGTTIARTDLLIRYPFTTRAAARRSSMRAVGARADEDSIDRDICNLGARRQRHVFQRAFRRPSIRVVLDFRRVGNSCRHRHHHARVCAPGYKRLQTSQHRSRSRDQRSHPASVASVLPVIARPRSQSFVGRRKSATLQVSERCFVRRNHSRARAGFDAHVAERHAAFHRKRAHGFTRVFNDMSGRAVGSNLSDDSQRQIFRSYSFRLIFRDVRTSIVRGLFCGRHCVASTCSTSLVPMPKASAPKAPCVLV